MTDTISDAELRVAREYLGLTQDNLARLLHVQDRTIRRWEAGTQPVPDGAVLALERIEQIAADMIERGVLALNDASDPVILVYRTDEEYWAAHPDDLPYPASFHRAVVARIAHEVPGLEIEYPPVDHDPLALIDDLAD